jgi:hypothetical protein
MMILFGAGTSMVMPGHLVDEDLMRIAEVHHELLALLGGTVADAVYLELLAEALRHALDHVGYDRAGKTVQRFLKLLIGRAFDMNDVALDDDLHIPVGLFGERSLRPFDGDNVLPSTLTSTPAGMVIGILPIRDILQHPLTIRTRGLRRPHFPCAPDGQS